MSVSTAAPGLCSKGFVAGTHRTCAPAETFERYRHLMEVLGITRIANITGLDTLGIPVFTAIRPNGATLATSQGKGLDADAARTSALMEAIELWHSENVRLPTRHGTYASLHELDLLNPATLPTVNGDPGPDPVQPWVEGVDLLSQRATWVPRECVDMSATHDIPVKRLAVTTNGLASGNHPEEATVHALCELIERDAWVLWTLRAHWGPILHRSRRVRLDTVTDPACRHVLDQFEVAGVLAAVWDLTTDLGIPVFTCSILEDPAAAGFRPVPMYEGHGCHLSPSIALLRALTEAAQIRCAMVSGSRDTLSRADYAAWRDPLRRRVEWLAVTDSEGELDFGDAVDRSTPSFEADLQVLATELRAAGIRHAIRVDLTRPDIGVPVVKVIVPDFETVGAQPRKRAAAFIGHD